MMNVRDKWIVAILIVLVALTGLTYYGFTKHNDTTPNDTQATQTIIVNGNGSSGTGDVQNVQQVTQVQDVGSGATKTVVVKQEVEQLTGNSYTPKTNTSG